MSLKALIICLTIVISCIPALPVVCQSFTSVFSSMSCQLVEILNLRIELTLTIQISITI